MVERQAKLSPSGCEARRKGTPARAQSSAVTGNDDFRLDEGPGFRGKSGRQTLISPAPAGTSPALSRRVSCFWASRSPGRVANHCDSTAFRAAFGVVSTGGREAVTRDDDRFRGALAWSRPEPALCGNAVARR